MAVGINGGSIFGPPEIAVRLPNSLNPGNQTAQTVQMVKLADWQTGRLAPRSNLFQPP